MGKAYTQVTMEERCEIARLRSQGSSLRQIAAGVDRPVNRQSGGDPL